MEHKKVFFTEGEGESAKGNADDFIFMLRVSGSEEPFEENQTIGSLYEATRYKILRLYVCTRLRL